VEPGGPERRATTRIPCVADAFVEEAPRSSERISDLGAGGAFVETTCGLPAGSRLTLVFRLPEREIRVSAEVRHTIPHIGAGVCFLDLGASDRSSIERIVRGES
jgi:hypothetical protein